MEMEGTAAIVTGGASGLGSAVVRMLGSRGAKVAIFDTNLEAAQPLADEMSGVAIAVDVGSEAGVVEALTKAEAAHGVARILVNCAGIVRPARVVAEDGTAHSLELFRQMVEINLVGTFNMLSQFSARLAAVGFGDDDAGVIINTASIAAYDGPFEQSVYASSKAGVVGLTLPAARDLARHRIRVMAIAPGIFMTPMVAGASQATLDDRVAQVPHPSRLGEPQEFAQLVASIIENPMLNGEVIRLDGAFRIGPRKA